MKDCAPQDNCDFNKFRRPLYFHGMLLDDADFRDEQEYHTQKRRLLNRMLHGSGVVCGLALEKMDDKTLTISCGLALDCSGCEIFVPRDFKIPVPQPGSVPAAPCAPPPGDTTICYRIRIACTEQDSDLKQVQLPGGGCDDKTCKATRKREGFCVKFERCECPASRATAKCEEIIPGFDNPLICGCGCDCSCGTQHWVSLGTVGVRLDGTISAPPTYQCREYVFSGQMLKQLFSPVSPATDNCACPDQLERFKDLLRLICSNDKRSQNLDQKLDEHIDKYGKARTSDAANFEKSLGELRKTVDTMKKSTP